MLSVTAVKAGCDVEEVDLKSMVLLIIAFHFECLTWFCIEEM